MPSGTIYGSTGNDYIDSKIEFSYTQHTDYNTSSVTAALYYRRNNSGFTTSGTGKFSISIAGSTSSTSKYLTIGGAWVEAHRWTLDVPHNNDGTRSIVISASGSIPVTTLTSTTCSGTVTLAPIPRAAVITSASGTLGKACSVKWNPASKSFRYKVKFSLGSWSHTTDTIHPNTTSAYTYTGYTLPLDVANQLPNAKTGTMTATLYTYRDSVATVQVGASAFSFTITVPENEDTKPKITMSLSPVTPYEKFASLYIQGRSKVQASFSGEGKYGASIVAYSLQAEGGRYYEPVGQTSYTSDILAQSGESTIVGFVSDSRWFGNNTSQKINVIAYDAPYISPCSGYNKVICERCTEDGTPTDAGQYLHVKGTRNFTKINTNGIVNTCSVRCRYKPEGGGWSHGNGEGVGVLLGTDTSTDTFDVILPNIVSNPKLSYTVEINITDDIELPSAKVFNIPSEDIDFELREGGKGAAFGKHAVAENLLEVDWDAQFNGKIFLKDKEITNVVIEEGASDIWTYRKWLNGVVECWGRRPVTVDISTQWESIYYGLVDPYAFPSGLFTDVPMCQVSAEFGSTMQAAWLAVSGKSTKDSAPSVMFCRPMIETAGFNIIYYAIGRWQ